MADFGDFIQVNFGPARCVVGWERREVGWVVTIAKIKKCNDTSGRVEKGYVVYMYPQRANFSLQDLHRQMCTDSASNTGPEW